MYTVIDQLEKEDAISLTCQALRVSRSAYYVWRQDGCNMLQRQDNHLKPLIRNIFWENKRCYGARRIVDQLADGKHRCSWRRVGRLMKQMGLVAIQPRSFKPRTTDSRHTLGYNRNLLIDAPPPDGMNQLWVGDIS